MNSRVSKMLVAAGIAVTLGACASAPAPVRMGDARFSGIHPGLTQEEVRSVAGAPGSVSNAPGETHWVYPFTDIQGMRSVYDVTFDASGHVDHTSRMRVGF